MVGCKMRWKKSVQNRQAPNLQCGLMQFANGGCQWPIPLSFCGPNRRNCTFLCSECCILYHPRHPTLCNTSREISHEITVDALLNALCISNISIKPIKMIFSKRLTVEVWMGPWRKGAVMLRLDSWWLAWPQMLLLPWWLLLEVVGEQLTAGSDPDGCQEGYDCCCWDRMQTRRRRRQQRPRPVLWCGWEYSLTGDAGWFQNQICSLKDSFINLDQDL